MSFVPNRLKVTPLTIQILEKAEYNIEVEHNYYSCIAINAAAYELDRGLSKLNALEIVDLYVMYVKECVFPAQWQSHIENYDEAAEEEIIFDEFFGDTWPDNEDRKNARITALQQFRNYLQKRLDTQDAEKASRTS